MSLGEASFWGTSSQRIRTHALGKAAVAQLPFPLWVCFLLQVDITARDWSTETETVRGAAASDLALVMSVPANSTAGPEGGCRFHSQSSTWPGPVGSTRPHPVRRHLGAHGVRALSASQPRNPCLWERPMGLLHAPASGPMSKPFPPLLFPYCLIPPRPVHQEEGWSEMRDLGKG